MSKISKQMITRLDTDGMFRKIEEFPEQMRKGWEIAENTEANIDFSKIRNIVFSGMGGSAISGDMIHSIHSEALSVPMIVNRCYQIPDFVNSETLFIASSYSGNTEETLSATEQAIERDARIICITSGGQLEQIARKNGYPRFQLIPGYPPRAALGYGLGVLLQIFHRLGIGKLSRKEVDKAVSVITEKGRIWSDIDHQENIPLDTARQLFGKIPLIYASASRFEFVGYRWKTQLNENSKIHAFSQPFPEMNHNEIVGWDMFDDLGNKPSVVILRDSQDHKRIKARMDIVAQYLAERGVKVINLESRGGSDLEKIFYFVQLLDFASYYLALLGGVDPFPIPAITFLKNRLSEIR